ncbi:MAG: hypothetical protein R3C59_03480 [Planctomycetaceae bacterium]
MPIPGILNNLPQLIGEHEPDACGVPIRPFALFATEGRLVTVTSEILRNTTAIADPNVSTDPEQGQRE